MCCCTLELIVLFYLYTLVLDIITCLLYIDLHGMLASCVLTRKVAFIQTQKYTEAMHI